MNFFVSNLISKAKFDFIKHRFLSFGFSLFLVAASFFLVLTKGINFGIDFSGGLIFEVKSENPINLDQIEEKLAFAAIKNPTINYLDTKNTASIKIQSQDSQKDITPLKSALSQFNLQYQKIDYVGPQIGESLIKKSVLALICALAAIFAYLSIRFSIWIAFCCALALLHDAAIVLGLYSLTSIEFCSSSVAALLTIVGYSINDSVVVFDKIRENSKGAKDSKTLINASINKTLSRTILTSFTTVISLLPIIFICSGEVADFAKMILIGILIGTYSSIFIAAPLNFMCAKSADCKVS